MNSNRASFFQCAANCPSDLDPRSPQASAPATAALDPAFAEMDAPRLPARLAWICESVVTSRRMAESA
jgi:hypothetical protein